MLCVFEFHSAGWKIYSTILKFHTWLYLICKVILNLVPTFFLDIIWSFIFSSCCIPARLAIFLSFLYGYWAPFPSQSFCNFCSFTWIRRRIILLLDICMTGSVSHKSSLKDHLLEQCFSSLFLNYWHFELDNSCGGWFHSRIVCDF